MIRPITCPICDRELPATKPGEKSFAPFCGERCQLVDFHRWWSGKYAIVETVDPEAIVSDDDSEQE